MEKQKNKEEVEEEIDEVKDEIDSALQDPKGIVSHQKRLAFCLSVGITQLLERYLKNRNILKPGVKIDHRLLKKSKDNIKKSLSDKIVGDIKEIKKIDKILDAANYIESNRDNLAYGKKASEELLNDLINKYLDIKKEIEDEQL